MTGTPAGGVTVRRGTATDLPRVGDLLPGPGVRPVTAERLVEELAAHRMRPEWTWLAETGDGCLLGRALFWGPGHARVPVAVDALDVVADVADRSAVAAAMLTDARRTLLEEGLDGLPEYLVRLPPDWREQPVVEAEVAWRVVAAGSAGLTMRNDRLQFEWRADAGTPPPAGRLGFREGTDEEFLDLFRRVAVDSLDVATQRALSVMDPAAQARDDFAFYLGAPGERSWWRVATEGAYGPVGFIVPSATPYARNVGYLGVLPEHRGRGLVAELLAEVVHSHVAAGADLITATTDTTNRPMAAAFRRAGFRVTESRVVLEESVTRSPHC